MMITETARVRHIDTNISLTRRFSAIGISCDKKLNSTDNLLLKSYSSWNNVVFVIRKFYRFLKIDTNFFFHCSLEHSLYIENKKV